MVQELVIEAANDKQVNNLQHSKRGSKTLSARRTVGSAQPPDGMYAVGPGTSSSPSRRCRKSCLYSYMDGIVSGVRSSAV